MKKISWLQIWNLIISLNHEFSGKKAAEEAATKEAAAVTSPDLYKIT